MNTFGQKLNTFANSVNTSARYAKTGAARPFRCLVRRSAADPARPITTQPHNQSPRPPDPLPDVIRSCTIACFLEVPVESLLFAPLAYLRSSLSHLTSLTPRLLVVSPWRPPNRPSPSNASTALGLHRTCPKSLAAPKNPPKLSLASPPPLGAGWREIAPPSSPTPRDLAQRPRTAPG